VSSPPGSGVTDLLAPDPDDPEAVGDDSASPAPKSRSRALRQAIEWVVVIVLAVVLALLVRSYVVQTYYIPSGSMEPTLQVGDRILVIKLAYRVTSPATGDVVVFKAPPDEATACGSDGVVDLVKRIVAVPGQVIVSKGNRIYVNGKLLQQPWTHKALLGKPIDRQIIKPDQYFVLGDNRPNSCDSRVWGQVPRSDFIGKAVLVFWPLHDFGTL
jgi:signal peptidase I